eukprot:NODE_46_length_3035_cov_73.807770_g42_i0.p1 GENE.NODE_46_length_3035_cov_73.807770_g42_i0~~NODE_46_length_3035_cov_73.807770_g42_i0.p1  ORF type:complete len:877 (+),score=306.92 NODE_46_length_3035_cov_73.807770_g42_i0:241-2871(+)
MTLGRDVSMLYPDVVKLSRTSSMELKKLVYLYILNNSKLQPEKAIMAVNTFVQDCGHESAVVRALAVRTMLCVRVEEVVEYTTKPLHSALKDSDAYVRKTAALGVLKLYAYKPELVESQGFLEELLRLLSDASPMVISNTVIALNEIYQLSCANNNGASTLELELTMPLINKLLNAIPECTEWGQIVILDYIAAHYSCKNAKDVEMLLDRIVPRLSHLNHSIVLSSIKVLMKFLEFVSNDMKVSFLKKLAPPIVSLMGTNPEMQYVVLRNILVVIQKYPSLLMRDVKVFYCKFTDPPYVKMEKLTILLKLLNEQNSHSILMELKEYCTEVDVEFVRKVVNAIGYCALKIESSAERCIEILLSLIQSKTDYIINDSVIAIKDILRKYPGRFESVIGVICENLDLVDSVEAKQSLVWIIGEYAEKIATPVDFLNMFVDNFKEEPTAVQLQILVTTVKVFLKYPENNEDILQRVLQLCTSESENPDLRDRGYIYWRLLSNDTMVDKLGDIVMSRKPLLVSNEHNLPRPLLEELLSNINTLASTFHRLPGSFNLKAPQLEDNDDEDEEEDADVIAIATDQEPTPQPTATSTPAPAPAPAPAAPKPVPTTDPLDEFFGSAPPKPTTVSSPGFDDIFGDVAPAAQPAATLDVPPTLVLPPEKANGLRISAGWSKITDNNVAIKFVFDNTSAMPLMGFAIQFNKNLWGFTNQGPLKVVEPLLPGASHETLLPLQIQHEKKSNQGPIQIAVKNNTGIFYFAVDFPFYMAFTKTGGMADRKDFISAWKAIPDDKEFKFGVPQVRNSNPEALKALLHSYNIFFVVKRDTESQDNIYFSALAFDERVLLELVVQRGINGATQQHCCCKVGNPGYMESIKSTVCQLLA